MESPGHRPSETRQPIEAPPSRSIVDLGGELRQVLPSAAWRHGMEANMGRGPILLFCLCTTCLGGMFDHATAGNNAGGIARLSWDENGSMSNLPSAPADSFPIYLTIFEVPDIRALAVTIKWFPTDPTGRCYGLLPSAASSGCGSTSSNSPVGEFAGEATAGWWTITAPLVGATQHCMSWFVTAAPCSNRPPALFTALVRVEDSAGRVDTLEVAAPATIGSPEIARLTASTVTPRSLPPETPTLVRVRGTGFLPGAHVFLHDSRSRVDASSVIVLSPEEIAATVSAPARATSYDLSILLPDGRTTTDVEEMTTVLTSAAVGTTIGLQPTNAGSAFRTLDLYADRSAAGVVFDHFPGPYPAFLTTDALLVTRVAAGDTMALLKSRPSDAIEFNAGVQTFPSFVEFSLNPPVYGTSIGLLQMGKGMLHGTGALNDENLPTVAVTARYINGDSARTELRVGRQLRNSKGGTLLCYSTPVPYYTQLPDDSLTAEVYASGGMYYDAQELRLPADKRANRISAIRVGILPNLHDCSFTGITAVSGYLNGLAIWPSFEIRNRQGGGLGLQMQTDSAWSEDVYGGYVLRDTLFGAFDTFKQKACMLSCMAMVASYFGDSVRADLLNEFLVRNRGYQRVPIVRVRSLTGQDPGATLTYDDLGGSTRRPRTAVGDTLLFEARNAQAWSAPLLTAIVGPVHGRATIIRRHQRGALSVDEEGYGYIDLISGKVATGWSQGRWSLSELGSSPDATPAKAESTMVDSLPVLLTVRGAPTHFVLARGWRPMVGPDASHGTYVLNDPGHGGLTRLSDGLFNNTFSRARRCQRSGPANGYAATTSAGGLAIAVSGGAHLSITGPGGGLYYDADRSEYVGDLPGVSAWPGYDGILDVDPEAGSPASDFVEINNPADGNYRLLVFAPEAGSYAISVRADGENGASPQVGGGFEALTARTYAFVVRYEGGASPIIGLDTLGTTAASPPEWVRDELRVRSNPARGAVDFELGLSSDGRLRVDVFDLSGRRVRQLLDAPAKAGVHSLTWDARDGTGVASQPGLYFVRAATSQGILVRRIVLMD